MTNQRKALGSQHQNEPINEPINELRAASLFPSRAVVASGSHYFSTCLLAAAVCSQLILAACSSGPIKAEKTVAGLAGNAEGQWRGKALIRNLQTQKSGTLSLEIIAHEPSHLRMEVSGMMGIYLASFALRDTQVQYILAQQKKFVMAPADVNSLHDLVPIRITPQDLMRILFDRPLAKKDWECKLDEVGLPAVCVHAEDVIRVTWLERNGGHRKLKIESSTAEATLLLEESRSKVETKGDVYTLVAPAGYRVESRTESQK